MECRLSGPSLTLTLCSNLEGAKLFGSILKGIWRCEEGEIPGQHRLVAFEDAAVKCGPMKLMVLFFIAFALYIWFVNLINSSFICPQMTISQPTRYPFGLQSSNHPAIEFHKNCQNNEEVTRYKLKVVLLQEMRSNYIINLIRSSVEGTTINFLY